MQRSGLRKTPARSDRLAFARAARTKHGEHPLGWKQNNRTGRRRTFEERANFWVAASFVFARPSGLRISKKEAGRFHRWLLLARLSQVLSPPRRQSAVLAKKEVTQPGPRPGNFEGSAATRMESVEGLGTQPKEPERAETSNSQSNQVPFCMGAFSGLPTEGARLIRRSVGIFFNSGHRLIISSLMMYDFSPRRSPAFTSREMRLAL